MRNQNLRRGLVFWVLLMVCTLYVCPVYQTYAEGGDAFVVEEEAVFGGEEPSQEVSPPVPVSPSQQTPPVLQTPTQKDFPAAPATAQPQQEILPKQKENREEKPSVSANEATFVLPEVREASDGDSVVQLNPHTKREQKKERQTSSEVIQVTDPRQHPNRSYTIAFFVVGSICLILGIARILRRLRIAYGKL